MCTYNGERFLEVQLRSILGQTTLPDEVVVCDDGSSDSTFGVLERFRATAPFRVELHRNPERMGPAQNFSRCVGMCTGQVILLSDQDDIWVPDRVQQTRAAFMADPAVTLTYADAPLIDEQGMDLGRTIYSSLPLTGSDARLVERGGDLLPVLGRYNVFCGATMAVRASIRELLLPVPPLWMHDEWIALVANSVGRVLRLPRPVMEYRQHAGQQIGAGDWTLRTHLQVARARQSDFYESEIQRLGYGIEAVRARPELQPVLLPLLEGKREFCRDRLRIQAGGLRGMTVLTRLLLSGRYARYASALRSPFKDLLVMLGGSAKPGAQA